MPTSRTMVVFQIYWELSQIERCKFIRSQVTSKILASVGGGLHSYASPPPPLLGTLLQCVPGGARCEYLLVQPAWHPSPLVLMASLISLWETTLLPFFAAVLKLSIKVYSFPWVDPSQTNLMPGNFNLQKCEARTTNSLELYRIIQKTLSHWVPGSPELVCSQANLTTSYHTALHIPSLLLLLFLPQLARVDFRCSKTILPNWEWVGWNYVFVSLHIYLKFFPCSFFFFFWR